MPESTLRVVAHLKAKEGKAGELRELLKGLVAPTRREPGCIAYELLENLEDPLSFTFVEEWRDAPALGQHFETEHIRHAVGRFPELLDGDLEVGRYRLVD